MNQPCVCLCKRSHSAERGLCTGDATTTIRLPWGRLDLPVCQPCADAIGRRFEPPDVPTMPDPFLAAIAQGYGEEHEVQEIPVREVLSRLAVTIGGPLTEYVTSRLNQAIPSPERRALAIQLSALTSVADATLAAWDDLQAHQPRTEG